MQAYHQTEFYLHVDGNEIEVSATFSIHFEEYEDEADYSCVEVNNCKLVSWGDAQHDRARAVLIDDEGEAEIIRQEKSVAEEWTPAEWEIAA